jgi:hypothetical protein
MLRVDIVQADGVAGIANAAGYAEKGRPHVDELNVVGAAAAAHREQAAGRHVASDE